MASIDAVVLSPRFATEVRGSWAPTLNPEHSAFRWVPAAEADAAFMWPGQRASCAEIATR
jgi:hypothetical protein